MHTGRGALLLLSFPSFIAMLPSSVFAFDFSFNMPARDVCTNQAQLTGRQRLPGLQDATVK